MITCRELIEFLMDYLDGNLTPDQRQAFEQHLAVCPDCVAYLENYRVTVALSRAACRDEAGQADQVPEKLLQAILAARSGR